MDEAAPRAALGHRPREGDDAGREIGSDRIGDTLFDCTGLSEIVRRHKGLIDDNRIPAAQGARERDGIVVDAVAGADHGLVAEPVSQSDARREELVADGDANVFGLAAAAAQKHIVAGRIVALDTIAGASHQRIELVAQPDIDREVAVHLPAVASVPAELPLAASSQDVLEALVGGGVEPQQEVGVGVELVGSGTAVQSGRTAAESQVASGSIADLGLPVVQMVTHQVEAEAQLMRAMHVGQVIAMRIAFLDALQGHPVGHAKARVIRNADIREPALEGVGTICVRNAELESVVSPEIVGSDVLALAFVPDHSIQDEVGREGVGMANGTDLNRCVTQAWICSAQSRTARNTENRLTAGGCPHAPVLPPDRFLVVDREVDLGIDIVAAEDRPARIEKVVQRNAACNVGRGVIRLQLQGDRIEARGGNNIAGERLRPGAVRIAGIRDRRSPLDTR